MAKKKNSSKKHTFKHSPSRETATPAVSASVDTDKSPAAPAKAPASLRTAAAGTTARDFSYVIGDIKRVLILSGGLIALQVALYYLMTNTPLGEAVYNLVKV